MSGARVVVFGDGKHELGGQLDRALSSADLSALPKLIQRLVREPEDVSFTCRYFRHVQVHKEKGIGHRYTKKVKRAILRAKLDGFDAVAILIDRDRKPDAERIAALQAGRDALDGLGYPPCAVGAAVEAFDAWMICDTEAIRAAGGDGSKAHANPESLDGKEGTGRHPKDHAARIFGGGGRLGEKYAAVVANADLERLKKTCPKGFQPFAAEVESRLGSVV